MENNLPSILGGMAQGFTDFGKGLFDMFGTGGASVLDLIESAKTGNVTNRRQDDFRKWLYQTDSTKDAAAKGLGTALNGVQTVADYIPGVNALTQTTLGNAAQGALGGLADELKTYGEDYDLGRAGQRAAISAAGAAASGGLADALKGSSNALLSSNTIRGLARGATGGAITGGGYAAIDGGDVLEAAKQGAGMGALIGGATGAFQDFAPRKSTYNAAMTDEQRQARIANIDDQLSKLDTSTPEGNARYNELMNARDNYLPTARALETTLSDADMAVNSAKPAPERYIDSAGEEVPQALADYFKDASPLVRDENGNLIRFYHGTPNGSFDSPAGGSYFTPNREYADVYQSPNASSISFGKKATNPATYETYLDLRKPFDISDPEARRIYIDEYVKGGNATGINPYQSNYDDVKNIDWTEVEGLKEFLEGTGYGYDSIIADEGGVPDGNGGVVSRGKSYIPFESSQVFTLKKNLAQPMEAPVVPAAEGGGSLGAVDMSGAGENSKYFMDKYGDAIAKAGAGDDPEAMAALMMKRGNKDMVRDAFTTQQDSANGTDMYRVFREYGGSKPAARETLANALTGASANPPELVGYHGVDSEKLKKAINNFGGDIINPSLQVVNPEVNPGVKYGDVILLGNKDMYFNQGKYGLIDDTGKTNAYSRDVYSPRVPDFEEKNGNRYIAGTRTPYTAENVSKYMNKQGVKSVESTWTTPGSVAATQSHRFNNLSDILDYADQLGSKDSNKKAFDDFGDFLEKKVWDYAEKNDLMGDNRYSTVEYITSELQDALKGKYSPDDYYGLRTKAGQQLISDVRNEINKLPTDYFELKMNRPVGLKEFSGAILPQGYDDQEILAALKDAGVEVLGNYDQNNMDATLQDTLKNLTKGKNRFKTPYMLGLAGLLGGGAYMASQENDKEKEVK